MTPPQQELAGELGEHLAKHAISVEKALVIVYQPQVCVEHGGRVKWTRCGGWMGDAMNCRRGT